MTASDEGCSAADVGRGITVRVHTFSARATFSFQAHQRRVLSDGVGLGGREGLTNPSSMKSRGRSLEGERRAEKKVRLPSESQSVAFIGWH